MFLHFNMRRFKCLKKSDAGKRGEYYFTWRCYVDKNENDMDLVQGFSLGCPVDDGYSMAVGDARVLNDPKFSVELPDVAEGENKRVTLDLFAWESDYSTEKVKKLFSNEAAAKLVEINSSAQQRKDQTREDFLEWVFDDDNGFIGDLVDTGVGTASTLTPYVTMSKALFKLAGWAFRVIRDNSDDFLGFTRAEIHYTRIKGEIVYRWIFDNGAETWLKGEKAEIFQNWQVLEGDQGNELDSKFLIQIVAASPNEFKEPDPD